jgi:hypothetical protein
MKTFLQITLALVFLSVAAPVMAQVGDETPAHDERVKAILEDVSYDWEIDADGDFRAVLEFTDDRSQVLFVNSNTETLGNMEVREVWAVAATSKVGFSAEVMQKLLESSGTVKLGGWSINTMGDQQLAIFRAKVSANANASSLKTSIIAVATTADEMEKELLGTDNL